MAKKVQELPVGTNATAHMSHFAGYSSNLSSYVHGSGSLNVSHHQFADTMEVHRRLKRGPLIDFGAARHSRNTTHN